METERIVVARNVILDRDTNIFSVRWSPEDSLIAVAGSDGYIKIYTADSGSFVRALNCHISANNMPVTSVRWRPSNPHTKTKNILLGITTDGGIMHWHATSGKLMHSERLRDNHIYSLDYSPGGSQFCVGCRDNSIKIFDDHTKQLASELSTGRNELLGHVNRIHSVKFVSEDMVISGGWDRNVLVWDTRANRVSHSFYGPNVMGDSLDYSKGNILAGSHDIRDQLQIWSVADQSHVLSEDLNSESRSCMVFTAQYSKADQGEIFAVGGGGSCETYFYETKSLKQFSVLTNLEKSVYSLDFANESNKVALGCGDGTLRTYEVVQNSQETY